MKKGVEGDGGDNEEEDEMGRVMKRYGWCNDALGGYIDVCWGADGAYNEEEGEDGEQPLRKSGELVVVFFDLHR